MRSLRAEGFDPLRYPLDHLPDTNFGLYALQLNLYRYILESEYAFDVSGMFLAVVHPELSAPRLIAVPRLDAEISALHDHEIEHGRAIKSAPSLDYPFVF